MYTQSKATEVRERVTRAVIARTQAERAYRDATLELGHALHAARCAGMPVRELRELCKCSHKQVYVLMNKANATEGDV